MRSGLKAARASLYADQLTKRKGPKAPALITTSSQPSAFLFVGDREPQPAGTSKRDSPLIYTCFTGMHP